MIRSGILFAGAREKASGQEGGRPGESSSFCFLPIPIFAEPSMMGGFIQK